MLEHELGNIPDFENFVKIEPISEGLSKDKKFYVESAEGKQLLLRTERTERPAYPEYIRGVFACDGDNPRRKAVAEPSPAPAFCPRGQRVIPLPNLPRCFL